MVSGPIKRKIEDRLNLPVLIVIPLFALCEGGSAARGGGADSGLQERAQKAAPERTSERTQERTGVASEPAFSNRQSDIRDALRTVIRDAESWQRLWTGVAGSRTPPPDRPDIDFGQEMVIVAALGMRGTGGYGIEIQEVYLEGARLVAVVVETSPGPDCMTTQAFSAPAVGVRVAHSDLPVTFVERRVTLECE